MAKYPIIARLPEIWRRLDVGDVSRRFFGALDNEIDNDGLLVEEYLSFVSVDKAQDKFLPILAELVGHRWRDDKSFLWNRDRIRFSLKRASYKGTTLAIEDLAIENGSIVNQIQDNASKLLILGKQGRLGCDDAYLVSADYWHDGAFLAQFSSTGDTEELATELPNYIPAGQVWFIEFVHVSLAEFITDYTVELIGTTSFTNSLEGTIGYGLLGESLLVSSLPCGQMDQTYSLTIWVDASTPEGSVGYGLLGEEVFFAPAPALAPDYSFHEIGWHDVATLGTVGNGILGYDLFLSIEPSTPSLNTLDDYVPEPVSIGSIIWEMVEGNIAITTDTYTQLTSLAFEMADVDLVICPSLQIDSTTLEATEANIAITHDPHIEVPSGELEMAAAEIEIDELVMGSIHYTLADIATLDEENR